MKASTERRALITGISGQDGAYLSRFLLSKKYEVIGTSRLSDEKNFTNLYKLGIRDKVEIQPLNLLNGLEVYQYLNCKNFDEVYHLAGESSVRQSYNFPVETISHSNLALLNLLDAARRLGKNKTRFFIAASCESFGDTRANPADELTPFDPKSPYAIAKATTYHAVKLFRNVYGVNCCAGILSNHESPLRSERFVIGKILNHVRQNSRTTNSPLELGDLSVERDWGWAPEYVEAMWSMLGAAEIDDYVIATGATYRLEQIVSWFFEFLGLDYKMHVVQKEEHLRPDEVNIFRANPSRISHELGWRATIFGRSLVEKLLEYRY